MEEKEGGEGEGDMRDDCIVLYCMYYTCCCNALFIGVVEDDGMK